VFCRICPTRPSRPASQRCATSRTASRRCPILPVTSQPSRARTRYRSSLASIEPRESRPISPDVVQCSSAQRRALQSCCGSPDFSAVSCISLERFQTVFRTSLNSTLELLWFGSIQATLSLTRIVAPDTHAASLVANEAHERIGEIDSGCLGMNETTASRSLRSLGAIDSVGNISPRRSARGFLGAASAIAIASCPVLLTAQPVSAQSQAPASGEAQGAQPSSQLPPISVTAPDAARRAASAPTRHADRGAQRRRQQAARRPEQVAAP